MAFSPVRERCASTRLGRVRRTGIHSGTRTLREGDGQGGSRLQRRKGTVMAGRTWSDLTPTQQAAVLVLGSVQVSLAATAWADLARRPAESVNGSKPAGCSSSPST